MNKLKIETRGLHVSLLRVNSSKQLRTTQPLAHSALAGCRRESEGQKQIYWWVERKTVSRHGGVGLMVGLDDLRGVFQPMIL